MRSLRRVLHFDSNAEDRRQSHRLLEDFLLELTGQIMSSNLQGGIGQIEFETEFSAEELLERITAGLDLRGELSVDGIRGRMEQRHEEGLAAVE